MIYLMSSEINVHAFTEVIITNVFMQHADYRCTFVVRYIIKYFINF